MHLVHLEFALRHEGMHLQLLRALLPRYSTDQVAAHVQSKPTSAYARRLWLLYEELPAEIQFLRHYDEARRRMRGIVDLPNRPADLFIRLCRQEQGRLSKSKQTVWASAWTSWRYGAAPSDST